jgi:ketosteroid isomerase-like protein
MRLPLTRLLAFVTTVGLAACGGTAPTQDFGKPDVDQINHLVQSFVAAYNAKDVAKIGTFFAGNAALMPANQNTLRGVDSIKSWFEFRVNDQGAKDLSIEPLTVEGHGPLAYFAGTFSLNLQPPDGSPARHDRGKVLWILRKYAGQWKFECQIMSSDLPPVLPLK